MSIGKVWKRKRKSELSNYCKDQMFDAESSLGVMLQYHSPVMSDPEQILLLMLLTLLYMPYSFFCFIIFLYQNINMQTNTI